MQLGILLFAAVAGARFNVQLAIVHKAQRAHACPTSLRRAQSSPGGGAAAKGCHHGFDVFRHDGLFRALNRIEAGRIVTRGNLLLCALRQNTARIVLNVPTRDGKLIGLFYQ